MIHPDSRPLESAARLRAEIDGLRALALIAVMLYHAGAPWAGGGYVGVDIFLVVSGYVIARQIRHQQAHLGFKLSVFLLRRLRRLLPGLLLVLAACVPAAWYWLAPDELVRFGAALGSAALFFSNLVFWRQEDYFGPRADENPLLHTWSLGVEAQFYVAFPLLMMATAAWSGKRRAWTLVVLAGLSLVLAHALALRHAGAAFYLPLPRAWELLVGAALSLHPSMGTVALQSGRWRDLVCACGLGLALAGVVVLDARAPQPALLALMPVLGTLIVLATAEPSRGPGRLLASRPLVGLGLISYSAYLWHQPLLAFLRVSTPGGPSPVATALALFVALALAAASWHWVEKPWRDPARTKAARVWQLTITGSAIAMLCSTLLIAGDGIPSRLRPEAKTLLASAEHSGYRLRCHTYGEDFLAPTHACVYLHQPASWAVLGDSHVVELAQALAEQLDTSGQGLLHLSFSNCPPGGELTSRTAGCRAWLAQALDRLLSDAAITDVVVGFRHHAYLALETDSGASLHWQAMRDIVERLHARGKTVHVLMPVPELARDVRRLVGLRRPVPMEPGQTRTIEDHRGLQASVLSALATLDWDQRLVALDPLPALCEGGHCPAVLEGRVMYFDNNHLSLAGARRVAAQLRLREAAR